MGELLEVFRELSLLRVTLGALVYEVEKADMALPDNVRESVNQAHEVLRGLQ